MTLKGYNFAGLSNPAKLYCHIQVGNRTDRLTDMERIIKTKAINIIMLKLMHCMLMLAFSFVTAINSPDLRGTLVSRENRSILWIPPDKLLIQDKF
jgi:hypothetical protein